MSSKRNKLKWTPVTPIRRPDNIISSQARETGNVGFIPSYEKDPKECMNLIMANEYLRKWLKERAVYEKDTYSSQETEKDKGTMRRRYVVRDMRKKKYDKIRDMAIITLKRFEHIKPRTCLPPPPPKEKKPEEQKTEEKPKDTEKS